MPDRRLRKREAHKNTTLDDEMKISQGKHL
jgi:hypothetical protein